MVLDSSNEIQRTFTPPPRYWVGIDMVEAMAQAAVALEHLARLKEASALGKISGVHYPLSVSSVAFLFDLYVQGYRLVDAL